ncbi:MAG: aminomethyl-transferring glycine dehydrogenase subunit GcvPA [Nitrososphaeria archaeon]
MTNFMGGFNKDRLQNILNRVGVKDIEEFYADVPKQVILSRELNIHPSTEKDVESHIERTLEKNKALGEYLIFLGAGLPPHHLPAAVETIVSRSEFYTAYTPYQPEISQGMLQALFEYQSIICDLTGMDVANSSMYDWATAAAEAIRMAIRVKGKKKVLLGENVGPERKKVIRTYLKPLDVEVQEVDYLRDKGSIDLSDLEKKVLGSCCLYLENPNFFGVLEKEAFRAAELVHGQEGLLIVGVDPISLALVKPPREYDADIVVGEGQTLGGALNFGGPSLGIFACKGEQPLVRQMPGRIIGMTTDLSGNQRGFTMVLQTREQHIRRENATSNICTNEALMAIGALSYLTLLGSKGLRKLGLEIYDRAHYASKRLSEAANTKTPHFSGEFFQEFTITFKEGNLHRIFGRLLDRRIIPGLILEQDFPQLKNTLLSCFTEVHNIEDIDELARAIEEEAE